MCLGCPWDPTGQGAHFGLSIENLTIWGPAPYGRRGLALKYTSYFWFMVFNCASRAMVCLTGRKEGCSPYLCKHILHGHVPFIELLVEGSVCSGADAEANFDAIAPFP